MVRAGLVLLGVVAVAVLVGAPSAVLGARDALAGRRLLAEVAEAVRAQDADAAAGTLAEAAAALERADGHLGSPWTLPARFVPGLGRQLRAAHGLAEAGVAGAEAAEGIVGALEARPEGGWLVEPGTFDLAALRTAGERLAAALPGAEEAVRRAGATPGTWLVGPMASRRAAALEEARSALRGLRRGAGGLSVAPEMLGADGPRRYYLAFANLSELRGSGGFLGYFSVLEVEGGELHLLDAEGRPTGEFPQPSHLEPPEWFTDAYGRFEAAEWWQNLNVTTDFPTAGRLITQAIPDELGPVDGVVQIDPLGLEPILELTGPVPVEGWPEPITAGNVSRVTQHEAYQRYDGRGEERVEFLGRLIDEVFGALVAADVDLDEETLGRLGEAAAGGHVQVYASRTEEEEALRRAGLARGVDRAADATDVLGVVNENAGANKADWFLRRQIRYSVSLDPGTREARGRLTLAMRNRAPASGEPSYVIGPNIDIGAGVNRTLLMLLRPPDDQLDGFLQAAQPTSVSRAREDDLRSYQRFLDIPPRDAVQVEAEFRVPEALRREGDELVYRLRVLRQPIAHPDDVAVQVRPPPGWEVSGETTWSGDLTEDVVVEVRLSRSTVDRVVDALFVEPFRLARRLIGSVF